MRSLAPPAARGRSAPLHPALKTPPLKRLGLERLALRHVAAVLVVGLAAALRLGRLELAQFQSDEATWLRIAEDLVRLGTVPLDGPLSSQGIPQAPHFEYFLAAAVAISREPMLVTGAVGLANVAGVAWTVWLGWRAFGPLAGLVAGALFAVQPGAVFYARKIWPPDGALPLGVLFLVALEYGVVGRRAGWAAASLVIGVWGTLTYFAFAVLMPVLLAPIVVLVRARRWALLACGSGLAVLVAVPYLMHHVQTGWEDVKNFRYYASSVPVSIDTQALNYALSLATGWGGLRIADVLPPTDALPAPSVDAGALLATLLLGLAVLVAVWQVLRAPPRSWPASRIRLAGLLVWLALPVLATTRHTLPLQPHYYLVLLPVPYLLVGMLCQWLLVRRRVLLAFALAGLGVVLVVQVLTVGRLLEFIATQYEPCYGAPMRSTEDIGRQAIAFGAAGGATRASVENQDGDADSIAYLLRGALPRVDLAGVGPIGLGLHEAPGQPDGRSVLEAWQPLDLSFAPGLRATAASVSDDPLQGGRVRVALDWRVDQGSTWTRPLVWEVRLSNADGQVVQRASGIDHVPTSMRGEDVLSWFTLDTPREIGPGPYQMHLRLIDADRGQAMGDEWVSSAFAIRQTARCRG